ncbi:MAG: hypothetical protein ACYC5M_14595 [Anaerolineae bacterium]
MASPALDMVLSLSSAGATITPGALAREMAGLTGIVRYPAHRLRSTMRWSAGPDPAAEFGRSR